LLFTIHLATRRVQVAGITPNPNGRFVHQVARQLTDEFNGPLRSLQYVIMDRDDKFTRHFKAFLRRDGIEPVLCSPRAPNRNPYAERFGRSIKEVCEPRHSDRSGVISTSNL
jgi:putative transposase